MRDVAVLEEGERVPQGIDEPVLHTQLPPRDALALDLRCNGDRVCERPPLSVGVSQSEGEKRRGSKVGCPSLGQHLERDDTP